MNLTHLALEALAYVYPSNAASNQATMANASTRQLQRIASDAQAVLQDIYRAVPSFYRRAIGGLLAAPQDITVQVTAGSPIFTTGTALVNGSTIVISGDPTFNRTRTEAGVKSLLYPYQGTTGPQTAILYGDVILLGSSVAKLLGRVKLGGGIPLEKAHSEQDLYNWTKRYPSYGRMLRSVGSTPTVGQPQKYLVDSVILTETVGHSAEKWLRFNPMPDIAYQVSYTVQLKAPALVVGDLGTDISESTFPLVVPEDAVESLLRPLFLLRWSASPWFKDEEARKQITADAGPALAAMAQYRAMVDGTHSASPR